MQGDLLDPTPELIAAAEVLAAGGVVLRRLEDRTELAVVHRPKYDDWSLPKGKLEPGESFDDAALREVEEETGLKCRLLDGLGATSYEDHKGRRKVVLWWLMEPLRRVAEPDEEVDAMRWMPIGEAARNLTYELDRRLLGAALIR